MRNQSVWVPGGVWSHGEPWLRLPNTCKWLDPVGKWSKIFRLLFQKSEYLDIGPHLLVANLFRVVVNRVASVMNAANLKKVLIHKFSQAFCRAVAFSVSRVKLHSFISLFEVKIPCLKLSVCCER